MRRELDMSRLPRSVSCVGQREAGRMGKEIRGNLRKKWKIWKLGCLTGNRDFISLNGARA